MATKEPRSQLERDHRERVQRMNEFMERDQAEQAEFARLMRDGRTEEATALAMRRFQRAAIRNAEGGGQR